MSQRKITDKIRLKVEQRAGFCCEYCQTTMATSTQKYEVEHIISIIHGGSDDLGNLALSCRGYNAHKPSKIEGFDRITQKNTALYHPRRDSWSEHFAWDNNPLFLIGLTPVGRATIQTLKLNRPQLISVRKLLQQLQLHPPSKK